MLIGSPRDLQNNQVRQLGEALLWPVVRVVRSIPLPTLAMFLQGPAQVARKDVYIDDGLGAVEGEDEEVQREGRVHGVVATRT